MFRFSQSSLTHYPVVNACCNYYNQVRCRRRFRSLVAAMSLVCSYS